MCTTANAWRPTRVRRAGQLALILLLAACKKSDMTGLGLVLGCLGSDSPCPPSPTPPHVEITASSTTLITHTNLQLHAALKDSSGKALSGRSFVWWAREPGTATVDAAGMVTGVGAGQVYITATASPDGIYGSIVLTVLPGPAASVSVTPTSASVRKGESRTLTAQTLDAYGNAVPASSYAWSSGDTSLATVSSSGVVSAIAIGGPVTITATNSGLSGSASITVTPPASMVFTQMTLGLSHTCGLIAAGQAYCWGINSYGELGDGTTTNRATIAPVLQGDLSFVQIVSGGSFTCGLAPGGQAYCWGWNLYGQLGDGGSSNRVTPNEVLQGAVLFQKLAAASTQACGLTSGGRAYCWGMSQMTGMQRTPQEIDQGSLAFASLSVGRDFVCGLSSDGQAYCRGVNSSGELGDGTTTARSVPTKVLQSTLSFTAITAQLNHACGLTSAGQAYCWGENHSGQIGDNTLTDRLMPTMVLQAGVAFEALSAGMFFTCARTDAGQAYCWGMNSAGALGDNTTTYRVVPTKTLQGSLLFAGLTAGARHTCGWTQTGKAWCWGENENGQLGDGTLTDRLVPVPVRVP